MQEQEGTVINYHQQWIVLGVSAEMPIDQRGEHKLLPRVPPALGQYASIYEEARSCC